MKKLVKTVGSICSGIEAASVAWSVFGWNIKWFSEIADYPSRVLKKHYPDIPNLGDMNDIPELIRNKKIEAPDMLCGGTPCQAFSLAGYQQGLNDDRGNLTLRFVDIVEANDEIRLQCNKNRTIVFWENVEGVLTDKTNAFGCLVSSLAGLKEAVVLPKWPSAGLIKGPKRKVVWRVIDAKYFGLPQQRKRLYLIAGDSSLNLENVLFEPGFSLETKYPSFPLVFEKDGHSFEVFREYTDCLYTAYGTKWNGNAAAFNGSLFVVQDKRIRRLNPEETELLMGFPAKYTWLEKCRNTTRYQATGNSWAVPVVRWIGNRIDEAVFDEVSILDGLDLILSAYKNAIDETNYYFDFGKQFRKKKIFNASECPEHPVYANIKDFILVNEDKTLFISPVGCYGIVRRHLERKCGINPRLKEVLLEISNEMSKEEIEERSKIWQKKTNE